MLHDDVINFGRDKERVKRPQKQTAKSKLPIKKMAKELHRESSREFYELNVARLCGTKSHIIIFSVLRAVGATETNKKMEEN